ncbi:MAG: DUF4430 domain-containing protein [Bacilli bacterium]|nr:DUF4430 domain-containing protein [Bacilli bacterium]
MKKVKLSIVFKDIWTIETICKENNIELFLKRLFKKNIEVNNNRIKILYNKKNNNTYFIMIDSKYKLLSLKNKVPNKFLLIAIDINTLISQEDKYKELEKIDILNNYLFQETKFDKIVDPEITKDIMNKIIKPSIVKNNLNKNIKSLITKDKSITINDNIKGSNKKVALKKYKNISIAKMINTNIILIKSNNSIATRKTRLINEINDKHNLKTGVIKQDKKIFKIENPKTGTKIIKPKKIHIITHLKKTNSIMVLHNLDNEKEVTTNTDLSKNATKKSFSTMPYGNREIVENNNIKKHLDKSKKGSNKKNNKTKIDTKIKSKQQEKVVKNKQGKVKDNKIPETLKKDNKKNKPQSITYTILSPNNGVLYQKEITLESPITVEELLMNTGLIVNNINGFISSINGIENEKMSGWVFEVNDLPVMITASDYIVNPNEQITWKYIDFSKEKENEETNIKTQIKKKSLSKEKNNF